jgi:hypothetical protein
VFDFDLSTEPSEKETVRRGQSRLQPLKLLGFKKDENVAILPSPPHMMLSERRRAAAISSCSETSRIEGRSAESNFQHGVNTHQTSSSISG